MTMLIILVFIVLAFTFATAWLLEKRDDYKMRKNNNLTDKVEIFFPKNGVIIDDEIL